MASEVGGTEVLAKPLTSTSEREPDTKPKDPAPMEDVPDPDEDDLDDLDDMLDEFAPSATEPKQQTLPTGPGRPANAPAEPLTSEGLTDEDFNKQLEAGMADLMGELETNPEMQAQLENMFKSLGGAAALDDAAGSSSSKAKAASVSGEESFQETIKKNMERLQASGQQATAAAASENTDDILAEMMKAMQAGGMEGEGSEEDFSKMILGMMEQLTNKEILYEPMKELHDKFPAWMEKNKDTVPKEDLKRYNEQQVYVREIVGKFEEKTYRDDNAVDREYIVERMQKMQNAGSPPPDLVGDMSAAQEAFGVPEEGCPMQ
ncbi:hypothetical protein B7494_g215 [Chlorociboria aeruginascens]|nr:hypothetical protein B7494_g215 [Chlorociboria aeruginascens]